MKDLAVKKFSSGLVTTEGHIDHEAIKQYANGMVESYYRQGTGLIVVTSGAKVAGRERAETIRGREFADSLTAQQLSGIGATAMFGAWESAFAELGIVAAGVAITDRQLTGRSLWRRLSNRHERRMFAGSLSDNFYSGVATILNEGDFISVAELFKENDGLGCHAAIAADAAEYQMFTKNGGLRDENGEHVDVINLSNIDWARELVSSREISTTGRGGFSAKIEAGWEAAQAGIASSIAAVNADMTGEKVTRFVVE